MLKPAITKYDAKEGSHASVAPRQKFRISYNDPLTGQKVVVEKEFDNSKEFPGIGWARDYAYTAAAKGWSDIVEIPINTASQNKNLFLSNTASSLREKNRAMREVPPVSTKYLSATTFNHEFSVHFSVKSDNPSEEVTEEELISGLSQRLEELRANKGLALEACGLPELTEIVDAIKTPAPSA
jgi:hypothetical protein